MNSRNHFKDPVVSVLLPVYNAEKYLTVAVRSLLSQTFCDFELLAIDDGSSDRSLAILNEFAGSDDRVRVLSRENKGLIQTLNEMIAAARGPLLARMDADDICRPQRFEQQVAYLQDHPECVAVGTRCILIDPEGMPIIASSNDQSHEEIEYAVLSGWGAFQGLCHPSVMMRTDAVVKIGGYSAEFPHAEDIDMFLRLAQVGRLANLPEVLLEYRQHLGSVGYAHARTQRDAAVRATRRAKIARGMIVTADDAGGSFEPMSEAGVHCKWAWWALGSGYRATARKHALKAFLKEPYRIDHLKVLACALRGR